MDEVDGDALIVAGGIGIAPLRALVETFASTPSLARSTVLCYGAGEPSDLIYLSDVGRWRSAGIDCRLTVDRDPDGQGATTGPVTALLPTLFGQDGPLDAERTTVFVCGPDPMLSATVDRLAEHGIGPDRIWLTLERNMKCGNGLCGHCQLGSLIVCRDGPVVRADDALADLEVPER